MNSVQRMLINILIFVLIIISGILLSKYGKPYNTALFTVHKLLAVLSVVIYFIMIRGLNANITISSSVGAIIATLVVSLLILFITGALMSIKPIFEGYILVIHKIVPIIVAITGTILFLLTKKTS